MVEGHAGVGRSEHERVLSDGDDAAGEEAVAAKVDEGDEREGEAQADLLALVVDVEVALELVRCGLHGQVVGLSAGEGESAWDRMLGEAYGSRAAIHPDSSIGRDWLVDGKLINQFRSKLWD